ncbi:hypothetical protein [Paenimyroides baculatum]|uniref:Transposase n=1 Tax=Paenimyroides baculatum TaxID=2608000 RepID=A0A5M6CN23_9FLAO|nr:hypothetical protein [Paenimyroides baculatum]KAA5535790.1 hypothetical protein F0460_04955 [Paenimyroides baculatum]
MEKTTMKLVRKIRLTVDLPTAEERKEAKKILYRWQDRSLRAANLIVSHLYVQIMIKDFLYLSEGVKYKLVDEKKDTEGILQCSYSNSIYRMLSNRFKGEIPVNILAYLNYELMGAFKNNYMDYLNGTRSLQNFKQNMAFPFGTEGFRQFQYNEEKKAYCFRLFKIPLKTYLGRGSFGKHELLEQLIIGKVKLCRSKIKIEKGKIFWLPVFEIPKEDHSLKPEIVAEASLSIEYPISVKIGKNRLQIGNKEEFLHRRLAIQAARARTMSGVPYCKGGKGRDRKLKALERFSDAESNYIKTRLHEYSKRLIDFCIENKAATLVLLDAQENSDIVREEQFLLRNWSYHELLTKIKYKADKAGIELITA